MEKIPSRPTTPHRRSNSAASNHSNHYAVDPKSLPLDQMLGHGPLEELSDSMASLDANLQNLQVVHESLSRFTESFSSFLHGIKMNAWCVEFSEAPGSEHFKRDRTLDMGGDGDGSTEAPGDVEDNEGDETYMTDNHSFIAQPSTIVRPPGGSSVRGRGGASARGRTTRQVSSMSTNRSRPQGNRPIARPRPSTLT